MTQRLPRLAFVAAAFAVLAACSLRTISCGTPEVSAPAAVAGPAANPVSSGPSRFKIVFLGDSLTAGLGLLSDQAYPELLQQKFAAEGYSLVDVVNAGISGDTTAGGLRRVDDALEAETRILVVALGGNDALRGLTATQTRDNLAGIVEAADSKGVGVVLVGMEAPTNLGQEYRDAFHNAFVDLVRTHSGRLVFVPFLLEGVAGNPELNQADGIHPNPQGAAVIAENLYPRLRTLVDQMGGGG
ncbi:MAG: arylesterase [Vicinamibacterales bacterium]